MNFSPPDTKRKGGRRRTEMKKKKKISENIDTDLNTFRIVLYSYWSGLVTFDHVKCIIIYEAKNN